MSSVDTRAVPCNYLSWPSVANLPPEQKFIGTYLFYSPDSSACGCYFLPRPRAAADLSLPIAVLEEALCELGRRRLITLDHETGEIFVLQWPRWMRFRTANARGALWSSIDRIQSAKLSTLVKKAYESIPRLRKGVEVEMGVAFPSSKETDAALSPQWRGNDASVVAAGKQLGLEARPGEAMYEFKERVSAAINLRRARGKTG